MRKCSPNKWYFIAKKVFGYNSIDPVSIIRFGLIKIIKCPKVNEELIRNRHYKGFIFELLLPLIRFRLHKYPILRLRK